MNCWGCDHCAPLAGENFLDVNELERDIKRLAELSSGSNIAKIGLLGGEPFLHPYINKFAEITRKYFPETIIEIFTNGVLLIKQPDDFWENCRDNKILIQATKYPIKIDWASIINKAKLKGVDFIFYGNTDAAAKTSYHIPFDITGAQDTAVNFLQCFHANNCVELYQGRIYTCTIIPHAKHFAKAFGIKLHECESDSIDIH